MQLTIANCCIIINRGKLLQCSCQKKCLSEICWSVDKYELKLWHRRGFEAAAAIDSRDGAASKMMTIINHDSATLVGRTSWILLDLTASSS